MQLGSRQRAIRRQFLRAEHVLKVLHVSSSSENKAANPKCVIEMGCSFCSQVFLAQATASWFPVPQSFDTIHLQVPHAAALKRGGKGLKRAQSLLLSTIFQLF